MTILKGITTSSLILGLFASVSGLTEPAAQSKPSSPEVVQEVKVTLLSEHLGLRFASNLKPRCSESKWWTPAPKCPPPEPSVRA